MRKWKNRPMTWGGYFKMCGVSALISIPISALYVVLLVYPNKVYNLISKIKRKFKR